MCIRDRFGTILEIVAMDSLKRRGQAFVVFDSVESAQEAKEGMQGFPMYDKPLRIQFAKSQSDIVAKKQGSAVPSAEDRKAQRVKRWADEPKEAPKKKEKKVEEAEPEPKKKEGMPVGYGGAAPTATRQAVEQPLPIEMQTPHSTIFVQNLPDESNQITIDGMFRQCLGFERVRMVPGRMGICFVDFETETQAGSAMAYLQGFQISAQHALIISYAKK
eukprot:TRINITY_DN1636_c0_g1_i3.p1 TRINITY_DN1636_c0_g1~~TRINITY_DN1636_c0_g1_i3.p1  ORF type:complete len:218 (+),score=44.71 TRINITY_DN1636_c0_g1_i3:94-747(+)